jgi:hypothetical protein
MTDPMKPLPTLDYDQLIADIKSSRGILTEAAQAMRGEDRTNYNALLKMIDEKFDEFQVEFPKVKQVFTDKYAELKERHETTGKQLAELEAQYAVLEKQIETGQLPKPQLPPERPVDVELGGDLRDELLQRFTPQPTQSTSGSGNAWQDWDLGGRWLDAPSNETL